MKTLLTLALLAIANILPAAEPKPLPPVANAPAKLDGFYTDTFLNLSTPDFSNGEEFGYGAGVGYQFNPVLAADLRVTHAGLNLENNAVSTVGGRLVSRLPWQFLSPYGFVGASFDLRPDEWRLNPGIGIELGVNKRLRGLTVFAEAGPNVTLKGHSDWLFTSGLRIRF